MSEHVDHRAIVQQLALIGDDLAQRQTMPTPIPPPPCW